MLKPAENGSEMVMPAAWFDNCFEMVHAAKRAFSELVEEIEYPMSQWGAAATDEYLNYSLSLLDFLNSITSSVSHLKLLKISLLHDVNLLENSRNPAPNDVGGDFQVDRSPGIELRPGSEKKELVILEALMELKEVVVSTLSLVVSGLSAAAISAGKCDEAAGQMREKLEVVENAILGIKKQAKDLFSEEVTTRNELMNNVRF